MSSSVVFSETRDGRYVGDVTPSEIRGVADLDAACWVLAGSVARSQRGEAAEPAHAASRAAVASWLGDGYAVTVMAGGWRHSGPPAHVGDQWPKVELRVRCAGLEEALRVSGLLRQRQDELGHVTCNQWRAMSAPQVSEMLRRADAGRPHGLSREEWYPRLSCAGGTP